MAHYTDRGVWCRPFRARSWPHPITQGLRRWAALLSALRAWVFSTLWFCSSETGTFRGSGMAVEEVTMPGFRRSSLSISQTSANFNQPIPALPMRFQVAHHPVEFHFGNLRNLASDDAVSFGAGEFQ